MYIERNSTDKALMTGIYGYTTKGNLHDVLDPGVQGVTCFLCGQLLTSGRIVSGELNIGTDRTYFYRVHANCVDGMDKAIVDGIILNAISLDTQIMQRVQKKVIET